VIVRQAKLFLKQFASPVLDGLGLYDLYLRKMLPSCWTIVMYHRIIDTPAADPFSLGMCVSTEHLEDQLAYFKRHFKPIAMSEAVQCIQQGQPLPARSLSVTFDDGYLDNQTLALPLLQKYQIPATLFVPTGGIDDGQALWWDRVIFTLDATDKREIHPADFGLPLPKEPLSLRRAQREATVQNVLGSLWTLPIAEILEVVGRLEKGLPPVRDVAPVAQRLNSQQLLQMHQAGIELGAHSVRHPNLTLESPESMRQEMQDSKHTLEQLCGAPVHGFAYPAGWKNAQAVQAALETGFTYCVATTSGVNANPSPDQLHTLMRVGMPNTPVSDFKRAFGSIVQRSIGNSRK
jgi:peptidoglycan/xylan/chitin deacetylase (PgdA/CDA1 family)